MASKDLNTHTETRLDDWDKFHDFAKNPGWLFRGEGATNWHLRSSLERCCDRLSIPYDERRNTEDLMIREFRRAYHQFADHVPSPDAAVEWLSIMQHHGTPTRLLDFTYSAYVAAYFATEEAVGDCVVWGIDGTWALGQSLERLKASPRNKRYAISRLEQRFMDDDEKEVRVLFMEPPYVPAAWPINPFRLNERLRVQQGVFLIQNDISRSFVENLTVLSDGKRTDRIRRIVISGDLRREVLRRLWRMDISRASLFPGLDGFARSLGINHSILYPNPYEMSRKSSK